MSTLGKMPEGLFRPIEADQTYTIGDLQVQPFTISHDAAEPVGYQLIGISQQGLPQTWDIMMST